CLLSCREELCRDETLVTGGALNTDDRRVLGRWSLAYSGARCDAADVTVLRLASCRPCCDRLPTACDDGIPDQAQGNGLPSSAGSARALTRAEMSPPGRRSRRVAQRCQAAQRAMSPDPVRGLGAGVGARPDEVVAAPPRAGLPM